jgi:DNA-binding NarL/FixJ family response regulator
MYGRVRSRLNKAFLRILVIGRRVGPIMSKRVLIADDSVIVRAVIRQFFEGLADWEVGEATDGTEAIQKAMELKPELILLDFCMPRLNGIEAASVLKRMMPKSYVILLTVFDDALSSRLTSAVGVDLIVPKTEGLTSLLKAVQHLTGTTGAIRANLKSDNQKRGATEQA